MPSRRRVLAAIGTGGTACLAGCSAIEESNYSPGTDDTTEWPMPAYDRGFSAYNPDAMAPRDGATERWSTELAGLGTASRPVVANGLVLVPTSGALVALDLATGSEQWRWGQERPWPSSPVIVDGTVYVGFADQRGLLALDLETGEKQWRIETRGSIIAAPTLDRGHDTLFVGDDTGRLYRIDIETGDITLRGEVFGPVTALAHGSSLLVGTESGEVYNLFVHHDTFTGLWRRRVEGWVESLTATNGAIYVGTFGGPVYSLDDSDVGTSHWELKRGATHLAATDEAVIGSHAASLQTIDARSGDVRWAREGNYDVAPAIAGDTIYIGGGEKGRNGTGFVAAYALSGGTGPGPLRVGGQRWRHPVESAVMEGVAIADGAVFAVTQAIEDSPATVYALEAM